MQTEIRKLYELITKQFFVCLFYNLDLKLDIRVY